MNKNALKNYKRRLKRDLDRNCDEGIAEEALMLIEKKIPVSVCQSDEIWGRGNYHWVVVSENEFWLDTFGKNGKERAVKFCEEMDLEYTVVER